MIPGCCNTCYLLLFSPLILYIGYKWILKIILKRKLGRWSNTPKDVVILHGFLRAKTIPSLSPFILKLETYLRMINIKYEFDQVDTFGPIGKTPWITLNGEHVSDTELIIEFLNKKFEKNLNVNYSDEQLAIGTLARITLEEHAFWGSTLWATVFDKTNKISEIANITPKWAIPIMYGGRVKKQAYANGMGRHTKENVEKFTTKDFRAISKLLGNKKYFLGDEPCAADAAIFAFVAQIQWGILLGSPYQKLMNDELKNLKEYTIRMKEKYWPDWDSICKP